MKTCTACGRPKANHAFGINRGERRSQCKECRYRADRARRAAIKGAVMHSERERRLKGYTPAQWGIVIEVSGRIGKKEPSADELLKELLGDPNIYPDPVDRRNRHHVLGNDSALSILQAHILESALVVHDEDAAA